jgi:hypothetical protein
MQKRVTIALGVFLLLLGVVGFVPAAVTYNAAGLALLVGVFLVDPIQNIIHVASGAVALLAGSSHRYSRWFLQIGGIVYAAMGLLGLLQGDTVLGLFGVNLAMNQLHMALAVIMIVTGFMKTEPPEIQLSSPKPPTDKVAM